jgi:hypothetical protein
MKLMEEPKEVGAKKSRVIAALTLFLRLLMEPWKLQVPRRKSIRVSTGFPFSVDSGLFWGFGGWHDMSCLQEPVAVGLK